MKRLFTLVLVVLLASVYGAAQTIDMTPVLPTTHDSKLGGHDINIQYDGAVFQMGCKSCHAPHNGARLGARMSGATVADPGTRWTTAVPTTSAARVQNYEVGQYKLWDKILPASAFDLYSSDNITPSQLSPSMASTETGWHSLLCLSCHDGATAALNIPGGASGGMNITNRTTNGNTDVGLINDHPINVAWPAGSDYVAAAAVKVTFPLYGASNMLQCASCHNVHDEGTFGAFLRADWDSNSGRVTFCRSCHVK